jgi:hypothetical protein
VRFRPELPGENISAGEPLVQKLVVVALNVPAAGVPLQPEGTGWVKVMSSRTTQQSGVVPMISAFMRTNRVAPAGGMNVRLWVWQLVLETLLNGVPAVVQGPPAEVAHSTVKVTELDGVAPPAVLLVVYCCTL